MEGLEDPFRTEQRRGAHAGERLLPAADSALEAKFEIDVVFFQTLEESEYSPGEERTFSIVIENLRDSYSNDKMSEISTSFCFICLLHLANEQGLEIEPARFDDGTTAVGVIGEAEGVEASGGRGFGASIDTRNDRVVGELQALKIRKVSTHQRSHELRIDKGSSAQDLGVVEVE